MGMHAQIAMERAPNVGWHNTMDKTIQRAQDQNMVAAGSYRQQALDQMRLDVNGARHRPFGDLVHNSGAGPMQLMLPPGGPPSDRGMRPNPRFSPG